MPKKESYYKEILIKFLQTLRLIHISLSGAMVLFTVIAFSIQQNPFSQLPHQQDIFIFMVPIAVLVGYFGGLYVFRMLLHTLDKDQDLSLKLSRYQTASLLHYACLEASALIALFAYIREGYVLYLAIAAFVIFYFISLRPSRKRILQKIPLNKGELEAMGTLD